MCINTKIARFIFWIGEGLSRVCLKLPLRSNAPRSILAIRSVAVTLVPEGTAAPKVRNLQFGDTSIELKNKEHSHASRNAHATATMMAAIVKK